MTSSLAIACLSLTAFIPYGAQEKGPGAQEKGTGAPTAVQIRHKNKITESATAAFERMEQALYRPVSSGLKELGGTLVMKMDMPGMEAGDMEGMPDMSFSYSIAFKAPADLKVKLAKGAEGPMAMMAGGMQKAAESFLRASLGLGRPGDDEEIDADAKTQDKKTVLTLTRYEKDVESSRQVMTLDDLGRIDSLVSTSKAGPGGPGGPGGGGRGGLGGKGGPPAGADETTTVKFSWAKEGDRWLMTKMSSTAGPMAFEMVPSYMDGGGFKLLSSFAMKGDEGMGMSMGFRFTELTVNGKKVEIPAAKGAGRSK